MMTEITEHNDGRWDEVFYDAECSFCRSSVKFFGAFFTRRGFRWLPMQLPGTAARLKISETELRGEMKLLRADGKLLGGIDAWICLLRSTRWLKPLAEFFEWPGIHRLADGGYRWLARNRYCFGGHCSVRVASSRHKAFFEMP